MEVTFLVLFHIIVINTLFIVVDYLILKWISKTEVSFLLIVLGGITSLFLCIYLTNHLVEYFFHDQWFGFKMGYVKPKLFLTGVVIFTVCTIIIELPFYILATKNKNLWAGIKSVVFSNLITNIPIGLLYFFSDGYFSID